MRSSGGPTSWAHERQAASMPCMLQHSQQPPSQMVHELLEQGVSRGCQRGKGGRREGKTSSKGGQRCGKERKEERRCCTLVQSAELRGRLFHCSQIIKEALSLIL